MRVSGAAPVVADRRRPAPSAQMLSPTWVLKRPPDEAAELLAERLDEESGEGRYRLRRLRKRGHDDVLRDENGDLTLGGRKCCYELMLRTADAIARIAIPSEHRCSCGTVWGMEYRVRSEDYRG